MGFNYDTWGGSWGTAWGGSWGSGATPSPPPPVIVTEQSTGGWERKKKRANARDYDFLDRASYPVVPPPVEDGEPVVIERAPLKPIDRIDVGSLAPFLEAYKRKQLDFQSLKQKVEDEYSAELTRKMLYDLERRRKALEADEDDVLTVLLSGPV